MLLACRQSLFLEQAAANVRFHLRQQATWDMSPARTWISVLAFGMKLMRLSYWVIPNFLQIELTTKLHVLLMPRWLAMEEQVRSTYLREQPHQPVVKHTSILYIHMKPITKPNTHRKPVTTPSSTPQKQSV